MSVRVDGLGEAVKQLNIVLNRKRNLTQAGLKEAGLMIQREAQKMTPVETGKLRSSAYTRKAMGGGIAVEVGFSAEYALWVHENMDVNGGYPRRSGIGVIWGPKGEPMFLEKAFRMIEPQIAAIVARKLASG